MGLDGLGIIHCKWNALRNGCGPPHAGTDIPSGNCTGATDCDGLEHITAHRGLVCERRLDRKRDGSDQERRERERLEPRPVHITARDVGSDCRCDVIGRHGGHAEDDRVRRRLRNDLAENVHTGQTVHKQQGKHTGDSADNGTLSERALETIVELETDHFNIRMHKKISLDENDHHEGAGHPKRRRSENARCQATGRGAGAGVGAPAESEVVEEVADKPTTTTATKE